MKNYVINKEEEADNKIKWDVNLIINGEFDQHRELTEKQIKKLYIFLEELEGVENEKI